MTEKEQPDAAPAGGREGEPDTQLLAWAVVNCHVLARRALARSTSAYDREKWEHVLRICEKAGARSQGVLRASVPPEVTDGSQPGGREAIRALIAAADGADWGQVVWNGGPPCFHLERSRGRFCLRAERWLGHGTDDRIHDHAYVSLADLLRAADAAGAGARTEP